MSTLITDNNIRLGNNYKIQSLGNKIGRYQVTTSIAAALDYVITLTGTNYSNGSSDRRFLQAYLGRRYQGNYSLTAIKSNGNTFLGSTSAFNGSAIGICIEQSNDTSLIFQIHNSGSSGPTSFFSSKIEIYMGGAPTLIEEYTGGIYTSNPF